LSQAAALAPRSRGYAVYAQTARSSEAPLAALFGVTTNPRVCSAPNWWPAAPEALTLLAGSAIAA
jgi:hypothetical protein